MQSSSKLYITDKILAHTVLPFIPRFIKPNYVTILRFLTTPAVLWFLWQQLYKQALIAFVLVAFTDALDGALARTRDQITRWGKVYDPLADKILICSVIYIIVLKHINPYLAFAIVFLELIIVAAALTKKRRKDIQANWWGKSKMICQVGAVCILLLGLIFHLAALVMLSSIVFFVALILGLVSLFTYSV
jgi:CDP-diacylglycerol--glycerol-3-phosphate 3-phosphatidyltransferase